MNVPSIEVAAKRLSELWGKSSVATDESGHTVISSAIRDQIARLHEVVLLNLAADTRVKLKAGRKPIPISPEELQQKKAEGLSLVKLAKHFKVNRQTIVNRLKASGAAASGDFEVIYE